MPAVAVIVHVHVVAARTEVEAVRVVRVRSVKRRRPVVTARASVVEARVVAVARSRQEDGIALRTFTFHNITFLS